MTNSNFVSRAEFQETVDKIAAALASLTGNQEALVGEMQGITDQLAEVMKIQIQRMTAVEVLTWIASSLIVEHTGASPDRLMDVVAKETDDGEVLEIVRRALAARPRLRVVSSPD